ncbi:MAG: DNA internalization-related competence protein ComEC/Rec2 [Myxococcota bacterium]
MWLDPVLCVALALCAGSTLVVAPGAALLSFAGIALVLRRRLRKAVVCSVLVALALGGVRAASSIAHFDGARRAARDALGAPARCALSGSVVSSPTWVGGRASYVLDVQRAECDAGAVRAGTRVRLSGGPDDLARGDRLLVVAQIAALEVLFNLDLADPLPSAARRGVTLSGSALSVDREQLSKRFAALIDRARAKVRRRIIATFAPEVQPMARALVLGENDLDPDDDEAFRKSGLSHMLAVSGTHLVFAVLSLVRAFTALLVRIERLAACTDCGRVAAWWGLTLALLYADFAGGSGSAWRAAYMLAAVLLARALGGSACASRALGISFAVGWLRDPLVAFDISFLLSAAATAGLLVLGEPLRRPAERIRSRAGRWFAEAIATTLAAMIPCTPLLALFGGDLTCAGIFANVVAAPLGEAVALPLCLLHAVSAPLPALEAGIALVASGALWVVRGIARESAAQRWLAFSLPDPSAFHLGLVAVLFCALLLLRKGPGQLAWLRFWLLSSAAALGLLELSARNAGRPSAQLRMTALAVGQGDSTLLDLPDGKLMLIDAGGSPEGGVDPGARVVVPALRARRRQHIDVVVLSHPHPDHFGGLLAVMRSLSVGEIWDSGQGEAQGGGPVYTEILRLARQRGIAIRRPTELCGRLHAFGSAAVRVLSPCPTFVPARGANDNSLVLEVSFGVRKLLLTGDAEHAAERDLLATHAADLRADVLKVGHHGSRTSSGAELLAAVRPRLATVSCGVRNRFGHPVPEVMARIAQAGARVLRTDRDGAIQIRTDGSSLDAISAYPAWGTRLAYSLARAGD